MASYFQGYFQGNGFQERERWRRDRQRGYGSQRAQRKRHARDRKRRNRRHLQRTGR